MSYSDNMVEPGAIVEALNKETEYTTKKHKLKKKYKKKLKNAYSARTAHPFQRNGAPFRFKLSKAQQVY